MAKYANEECDKEATEMLAVLLRVEGSTVEGRGCIGVYVCGPDHRMPDFQIEQLLSDNWEYICEPFENIVKLRPSQELAEWHWIPVEVGEEFKKEFHEEGKTVHRSYKN